MLFLLQIGNLHMMKIIFFTNVSSKSPALLFWLNWRTLLVTITITCLVLYLLRRWHQSVPLSMEHAHSWRLHITFNGKVHKSPGPITKWSFSTKMKHRKIFKTVKHIIINYVLQHCGYSGFAKCRPKHNGAINFTIRPLLLVTFWKICDNWKIIICN